MMKPFTRSSLFVGLALLFTSGCGATPTYPKAHLAQSLQDLLIADQLQASVRYIDHTLAVQLTYPGTLAHMGPQIGVGSKFDEIVHKVLTDVHRVVLSSDAPVDFYVLLLSDPNIPGAYLTIVRYMDDVRRANASMLDTTEMFSRTIFDLEFLGPDRTLTLEQYIPRDIHLEEFLSWQLARRIEHQLSTEFQTSGIAEVGRCSGEFKNGEFAFTLNVVPSTDGALDEATMQRVFRESSQVIAKVLSSYQFKSFNGIRLIHPLTGRNFVLPKANLELLR